MGFNITITDNSHLENDNLFKQFLAVYKHYSTNPPEFEIACFARYFAIASVLKNNDTFFLTDTDVFITSAFRDLQGHDFRGTFVGSKGYNDLGSEGQISPHCTVWNKELLFDFIHFTMNIYKRNNDDNFLEKYYQSQTEKLAQTAVSDMNLIYFWIKQNNVLFINSNTSKSEFGIDHNISSLWCEDGEFKSYINRKYLKIKDDQFIYELASGQELKMSLLHFQGRYKKILTDFYAGRYAKFRYFTLKNHYKPKIKKMLGKK